MFYGYVHAFAQALSSQRQAQQRNSELNTIFFDLIPDILLFWLSFSHFTLLLKMEVEWLTFSVI